MIEPVYFWSIILPLGIGTFSIRASFIFLSSKIHLTDRHREILSFIPVAVLPALLTPSLFFHDGQVEWLLEKERLVIAGVAAVVGFKTRSTVLTIALGLGLLFLLTQFG